MDMGAIFADFGIGLSAQFGGPIKPGSVVRYGAPITDDGGSIVTPGAVTIADCSLQIENATEAMRQADGYTDEDMRLLVLASTLEGTIDTDASIDVLTGPYFGRWSIASVDSDPFGVYWDCRGRRSSTSISREFGGTVQATSTASDDIVADGRLFGAVAAASSLSGSPQAVMFLAGSIGAVSVSTGAMAGDARLSSATAAVSAVSGAPTIYDLFAGSVSAVSTVSGALRGDVFAAGQIAGASTTSGALAGTASLSGTVAGQSTTTGAPRLWDPVLDLGAALLGYWDAERPGLITLSGSSVTTWTDVVGGYAPTQGVSGSKPIYSATSFNGRPGITFDGTDDSLLAASQPFPSGSAASEIWALIDQKALAADATTRVSLAYGSGNSATSRYVARTTSGGVNRGFANAGNGTSAVQVTDTAVDYSGKHVARVEITGSAIAVSVDGNTSVSTAVTPATGTTNIRIGGTLAGSNFANMTASAFLITSPLTTAQAAQMLAFLKARGGIP